MNRIHRTALRHAAIVLFAGSMVACGDSSGPSKAGPPASLTVVAGGTQEGQSGEPLAAPLTVKALDNKQRPVPNAVVTFLVTAGNGTLSAPSDTTDANGVATVIWTMGSLLGNARLEARVTGLVVPAVFNAVVKAGAANAVEQASPSIGNSASGFDLLDSVAVRVVDRFQHPIANVPVTFSVTAGGGSITSASKTTGDDGIARTGWRFGTAGAQSLRASAGAFETTITGTAVNCGETIMAVGDIVSVNPGSPACLVLNGNALRFIVTVVNTSSFASSFAGFRFRGANPAPATVMSATSPATPLVRTTPAEYAALLSQERAQAHAHADIMRANTELLDQLAPARKAQLRQLQAAGKSIVQTVPLPNLGDVLPVRIPSFQNLCSVSLAGAIVGGRVAYIGTHAIVLEDTLAPLRGQNDAVYQTLGQEFDDVMWPILTTNYGNPLAMDPQLDNNGRLFMLFSPRINTVQGGTIAGFVSSGDFFPITGAPGQSCAASNFGEYFYARVPNEAGSGFTPGNGTVTADEWLRETRTVIIHEVKHVTSFAEKFASPDIVPSGFFSQDLWLEESTAMTAEELWARSVFGYNIRGNVDYQSSIFCELRPTNATCQPSKPVSLFDHFYWLSQFAQDPETKSPIDSPSGDFSVYGSGWLFVRWLLDDAASESAFLSAIAHETQRPGVESIEARTGKSFTELIADWGTAFALDDYPGFSPANQKYRILSWNVRDIYSRLNTDLPSTFTQPFPLKSRSAGFGQFIIDISGVRGGSMSIFEIAGTQSAKQLLEFKGAAGTEFPAEFRINIARVQ
jgi:hypothetical protein